MGKKKSVRFQSILERGTYEKLRRLAFTRRVSMNSILREAVERYLKGEK